MQNWTQQKNAIQDDKSMQKKREKLKSFKCWRPWPIAVQRIESLVLFIFSIPIFSVSLHFFRRTKRSVGLWVKTECGWDTSRSEQIWRIKLDIFHFLNEIRPQHTSVTRCYCNANKKRKKKKKEKKCGKRIHLVSNSIWILDTQWHGYEMRNDEEKSVNERATNIILSIFPCCTPMSGT